jgi:hypothetical protein
MSRISKETIIAPPKDFSPILDEINKENHGRSH